MSPRRSTSKSAPADDVYTMAEAARLKGVSYHTVSRAVRRGKLPARRLGRMALISAEDLQTWRPMVERAPKKYRRREPDAAAVPALVDLASGERVNLARQLALLIEANHDLVRDEPTAFLQHLAERFAQAFDLTHVDVWRWSDPDGTAMLLAHAGSSPDGHAPTEPDENQARWRDLTSASIRPASGSADDGDHDGASRQLVAPLRIGANSVGVLIGNRGGEPVTASSAQLQFAQALANQAALAVELQRLRSAAGERPASPAA
ncbi:MAG TPA: helix-turn-helix domain-containing protein [Gemmataceae bacterium]|jgi:excisionase family DNA binding protein